MVGFGHECVGLLSKKGSDGLLTLGRAHGLISEHPSTEHASGTCVNPKGEGSCT